jgi:hypothetical protein
MVDFGAAPLSIGHVDAQNASPGTQVVVRGSGSATAVTVGGVAGPVIFTDENTLTLTITGADSAPQDIVLTGTTGKPTRWKMRCYTHS